MMRAININRITLLCAIILMTIPALTGCFKSDIAVEAKPNGSGSVRVSVGMTRQAQILASDQGSNPLQEMEQTISSRIGAAITGIEIKKWSEGDYDWISAAKNFGSLEEVNQVLGNSALFNHFSLTRKRGILQDEFILDAEIPALISSIPLEYTLIDTSAYIQMSFSARLPGQIVETNGATDVNDPNRMNWDVPMSEAVSVKARSLAWNWLNIFGMTAAALIFAALGIYLLIVFFFRQRKK